MLIKTPSTQSPVWLGSKPAETVVSFRAAQKLDIIKHIRCKAATAGRESKSPLKIYGIILMAATKRQVFKAVKKTGGNSGQTCGGEGLTQEGDWGSAQCLVPGCELHRYIRRGRQTKPMSPAPAHGAQAVALAARLAKRHHICGMTLRSGLIRWPLALTLPPSYQG